MKRGIITSETKFFALKVVDTPNRVMWVHFATGWRLIQYLSNINAEAQNN